MNTKSLVIAAVCAAGAVVGSARVAHADDCLEIGMVNNRDGAWEWHHAWIDAQSGNRVHIKYDFHHGELELKVNEHEQSDGEDIIVLHGRWFEGRDEQRTGRIVLKMERGHHHARGWYVFGDDEGGQHRDVELRDCRNRY